MLQPYLFVAPSTNRGRGVFTEVDIPPGTTVEISPVIVLSASDRIWLDKTALHDYIFVWGEEQDQCCMALGYIPLYNHSYASNCEYEMDFEAALMYIKTVHPIQAGSELFINYNGDWNDAKPLWFDAR